MGRELRREPRPAVVPVVVALGGVLGAEARYVLGVLFPETPGGVPWTTLVVNVSGSLVIGALLTVLIERTTPHPLLRPLLATGVLGGYTTFSTWSVGVLELLGAGRVTAGLGYLVATPLLAVLGCAAGVLVARRLGGRAGSR